MLKRSLFFTFFILGIVFILNAQNSFELPFDYGQSIFPKTGTWELRGIDNNRSEWTADVVIISVGNYILHGYIDWRNSRGRPVGREYFIGIYDKNSSSITFKGLHLENAAETMASSTIYEAKVSNDGINLFDGFWFGIDVVPGS